MELLNFNLPRRNYKVKIANILKLMKIKLKRFSYEEIPQLISWIPNKEFLLQWAGPSYTFEVLEKQLKNGIDMISR